MLQMLWAACRVDSMSTPVMGREPLSSLILKIQQSESVAAANPEDNALLKDTAPWSAERAGLWRPEHRKQVEVSFYSSPIILHSAN